ncbi:MAG: carotenoid 1,2-hydratase, partial [Bacteroidia bacterium]
MKKLITLNIFLLLNLALFPQAWKSYPYEPDGSLIKFPVDEGRHPSEPIEWWYTAGHLTGATTGKHYSYMLTYFYTPQYIFDGFRILNICDDDIGLFIDDTKALNYNVLSTDRLNIEADIFQGGIETWHNKTGSGGSPLPFEYLISAQSGSGTLNLVYDALKPPLILADNGYLNLGSGDYSYYYSQTKNAFTGSITFNGVTENVSGTSWIDRQYGTFNPSSGQEYEWFSVQLSNGMDFNIYNIFTADDEIPATQTFKIFSAYIDESDQYTISDFEIERLGYSYMPDSLRCYSQNWRITSPINNVDIIVSARHPNNEVALPFRFYEGSTTVTGTVNGIDVTGIGFAELTHSYEKPVIAIGNASDRWTISTPITWQTGNPDDGNPLRYDLEYSIDN